MLNAPLGTNGLNANVANFSCNYHFPINLTDNTRSYYVHVINIYYVHIINEQAYLAYEILLEILY